MLSKILGRLFGRKNASPAAAGELANLLDEAGQQMARSDYHGALEGFRKVIESDPYNVDILNNIGYCLGEIGDLAGAATTFELAYSLDDSYPPAIVNRAKLLVDQRRSVEALPFLQQAKICEPNSPNVAAVYGGACHGKGALEGAQKYNLQAWLASFEQMRLANCYLFGCVYYDMDEALMATEHRFWAETAHPQDMPLLQEPAVPAGRPDAQDMTARKIRIGYWSPDFRNHSVRYFFRPLLENHDTSAFETFLYHDIFVEDAQTEVFKASCTHFHNVYTLNDHDLYALIRSHELDILVELAGHSSYNRVTLLQQRFATVQISALGYPPTTGLSSIDAKLLDRHVVTPQASRYYAEAPLVLPTSFWCFDPAEDVPPIVEPPAMRNGYITFGCAGNIAKINERILRCWRSIFEQLPSSRLVIRSISLEDEIAMDAMRERLTQAGIPLERVDLLKPARGADFFGSYGEIDIILDTYPFNGGTTTCFAVYMGVPVLTWEGDSLVGRMGRSIMINMDAPDLVVTDAQSYIDRAVALAHDLEFLKRFRKGARERFKSTSLGDGRLFAREFEQACKTLLAQKQAGTWAYQTTIAPLPEKEIVRRAHALLSNEQTEAATRVLDYCLRYYPDSAGAHLLVAQQRSGDKRFDEGVEYLQTRLARFTLEDQVAAQITIVRLQLLAGKTVEAEQTLELLARERLADSFDHLQVQLYRACCQMDAELDDAHGAAPQPQASGVLQVLVPCDDVKRFDTLRTQCQVCCLVPEGWTVRYERCDETHRAQAYNKTLARQDVEVVLIMQRNLGISHPMFFHEILTAMQTCDMLGVGGATRWQRLDWMNDDFAAKAAGYLVASSEKEGWVEIQYLGEQNTPVVGDLAILGGDLLALRPARLRDVVLDENLAGADFLMEEDWTHAAYQAGCRLVVHRNLGVRLLERNLQGDRRSRIPGRISASEKHGFDPFAPLKDDRMVLSAPVADVSQALRVTQTFMKVLAAQA